MPSSKCGFCNNLNTHGNPETEVIRWKLHITNDFAHEYHLEFTSKQLRSAAKKGCQYCSIIVDGIRILGSNLEGVLDYKQPYRGRWILRKNSSMHVEFIGHEPAGQPFHIRKFPWKAFRLRGPQMNTPLMLEYYRAPEPQDSLNTELIIGTAKSVPKDSLPELLAPTIRSWLQECDEKHEDCSTGHRNSYPTRLLHLMRNSGDQLPIVKLVNTVDVQLSSMAGHRYATLSYSWGEKPYFETEKATLQQHMDGILFETLPKTFQDVISIVRALDINYIWIDSLCIVQDDEVAKGHEIARMAGIYANSYLNLAATGAANSRDGCLHPRRFKYGSRDVSVESHAVCARKRFKLSNTSDVFVRPSLELVHQRFNLPNAQQKDHDSAITPLLTRAWVFQERQLAPRTLHFHPSELVMECKTSLRCECTGLDKIHANACKQSSELKVLDDDVVLDRWYDVVKEYTELAISEYSDRLKALAGVATIFQERLSCAYLAGIWKNDLARGLLWGFRPNKSTNDTNSSNNSAADASITGGNAETKKKPQKLLINPHAPTWSWASQILQKDVITFPALNDSSFRAHSQFSFVDTNCPYSVADSVRGPEEAFICLRGLVASAELCCVETLKSNKVTSTSASTAETKVYGLKFGQVSANLHFEPYLSLDIGRYRASTRTNSLVSCLLVGTMKAMDSPETGATIWLNVLLFEQFGLESSTYKRVGVLNIRENTYAFKDALEMTVKLI